ncbi:MAG: UDP-N-acetylmuramoyl-L-alanyl-D-glutamate--2,6-diaminopimelate ligase [Rhodospirillales bacterium]|nr:UDP-N-acetylmuramoyl-L-alanyl-D-glutamate--2,6-diaminopimelate ligase [Rhodospirillales bacterium]
MRLADLLCEELQGQSGCAEFGATEITGLTCDSRKVRPGYLFAAFPGAHADGREFIAEALGRGAVAVLAPPGTHLHPPTLPVRLLNAENPRRALALMAARFYNRQPATIAAVTGTNGKTSVVSFVRQIWARLGSPAASMGTLGTVVPGGETAGRLTTPDAVDLHRDLAAVADAGVSHLAFEASSHGLAQHRLDGVKVKAAGFTNLTRDHLDYHGTMDAYRAAKMRLFTDVTVANGAAVINADDPAATAFIKAARERGLAVYTYGTAGEALRLDRCEPLVDGQGLRIIVDGRPHEVVLPLVGAFQAMNALCALGLAIATGSDAGAAMAALAELEGVRGRLQMAARHSSGAPVLVDYAHTPDALDAVLKTLRPHVKGRLIVVFGCGGDRDAGKRPLMGRIAEERADLTFVTDDNPRGEDPAAIRRQILAASPHAREIGDRRQAINVAVASLGPDDLLLVAGKGHEKGQIVGDRVIPFDDVTVVNEAVAEIGR